MKLHVNLKERGYDIVLQRGILHQIAEEIDVDRNVLLVSDTNVPAKWIDIVQQQCPHCVVKIVNSGEESKSFAVWEDLLTCMLQHHFLRSDLVIALGGGVVGDLAGFAEPAICAALILSTFPLLLLHRLTRALAEKPLSMPAASRIISVLFISQKKC